MRRQHGVGDRLRAGDNRVDQLGREGGRGIQRTEQRGAGSRPRGQHAHHHVAGGAAGGPRLVDEEECIVAGRGREQAADRERCELCDLEHAGLDAA
jgi:hypothetical protein